MSEISDSSIPTKELVVKYQLDTFIETGCFEGNGIAWAKEQGLHVYTCDIDKKYTALCKLKYANSVIMHMESLRFFRTVLPYLNKEKALFWLDAHFPVKYGHEEEDEVTRFPVYEELEAIKQFKPNYEKDVIIVDDMWCVVDENNPAFASFAGALAAEPTVYHDRHKVQEFMDVLENTHDCEFSLVATGLLIFTPKEV